jgi:hypothetical protein
MTTPTSFTFKDIILETDTVTFSNGIESSALQIQPSSINLVDKPTTGFIIPDNVIGYLTGSFVDATNVFTVGAGDRILFWNGTAGEFASVGQNGGNWRIAQ